MHLMDSFGLSERRACRLTQVNRSTNRYESRVVDDIDLRDRIKFLAQRHPRYGCPRIYNRVKRQRPDVNHKKVERIYQEEELSLRKKRHKKVRSEAREKPEEPTAPNQQWAMDFMSDKIAGGRKFRTFNVIDVFTREILAIKVSTSIPGSIVTQVLERIGERQGLPDLFRCDNGPEFTGMILDQWCYDHGVQLSFINKGKPTENCYIESFNGKFRDECLDMNWFVSLDQAERAIEQWRKEYNEIRPHSSLGGHSPLEFIQLFKEGKRTAEPLNVGG